ncbi:DUF1501 domain-containing protein [Algibacillus agarilyticus]|uniref:DUF1501 domain-containing protein n=1 Tax=Algibacillus agarilyticus TaxID=2234133 RepID=UPI000DD06C93|nr:DUF1501 domain-containing protein [Algibacillus agarilyticus]
MTDLFEKTLNRRQFLSRTTLGAGIGAASLSGIPNISMAKDLSQALTPNMNVELNGHMGQPHLPAKAKRVIYLFQSGGPSQLETFDYKPLLNKMHGQELPAEVRGEQVLTGMSAQQSSLPLAGSIYGFNQHGDSGAWVSEILPHTAEIVDDLCFVKSMYTDQINHDPAITFLQTGFPIAGRPSIGAWLNYGLGTDNHNLPPFIVMVSTNAGGQPLYSRLWGNGFLPSIHQGVQFRGGKDPVLYLNNPPGVDMKMRSKMMRHLKSLHDEQYAKWHDAEIQSRIAQYEMAERMQASVPDVTDFSDEPEWVFELYGPDSRKPGTYAANCLLARRLAERNVKFTQLYHQGWDQHDNLPGGIKAQCKNTDQASAALVTDLKQRGLLDDTLVIWGGEFGRTNYSQGKLTATNYGRDHHPGCFTMWMAGGGVKAGITHGETDEFGYNIVKDPVHVHDFQATLMHLMGVDHERLTYKYQGRRFRLTDVHGKVIKQILA